MDDLKSYLGITVAATSMEINRHRRGSTARTAATSRPCSLADEEGGPAGETELHE